jgi:hypothetical protein
MTIGSLFLLVAFICFILAALNVPRANWVAIGLASWVAASLFGPFLRG